ncbi:hypothetical protein L0N33_22730, partial [Roseburia faecis]|nr:hypothetical protein [Roseburia faecis]
NNRCFNGGCLGSDCFYRGCFFSSGFNSRRLGSSCFNNQHFLVGFNNRYGFSRGRFLGCFGGAFCLLVRLGFSWSADGLGGN